MKKRTKSVSKKLPKKFTKDKTFQISCVEQKNKALFSERQKKVQQNNYH